MQLFGSSGMRFVADRHLLALAVKAGLATGKRYRRVLVGNDNRTTSGAVKSALLAGLSASGARVFDSGLLPTPALAYAGRGFEASVMVTASHNPPEYNGLKFFNPDGAAFGMEQQQELEEAILHDTAEAAGWQEFSEPGPCPWALELHMDRILSCFTGNFPIKVVLDCGGGAASVETPGLLRRMGCEVIELNCRPSGIFVRPSEPAEANLAQLKETVKRTGADLGLAHDGDADRLMAVDELGRYIQGDKLLLVLVKGINARKVVTTMDVSSVIDEQCIEVRRTRVGDSYVSRGLKTWGDFGGETSGSWIFPSISLSPDGIYAAAQLVSMASCRKLSELVDCIPGYPLIRGSVNTGGKPASDILDGLKALNPLEIDTTDGFKLVFEQGWVLIRPSGTEPKIRITAEAPDPATASRLYNRVSEILSTGQGQIWTL